MRCKYCGSESIHAGTQHRNFSGGKAVAGAVTFGVVGAAAGFIGKEVKGYRCGACGAFMDEPMYILTESSINDAIREAKSGRSRTMYDYLKRQYPNMGEVPVAPVAVSAPVQQPVPQLLNATTVFGEETHREIKRVITNRKWHYECPVHIGKILISTENGTDILSLLGQNQSEKAIRSIYLTVQVMDDTGDKLGEETCVYQNISCQPGAELPKDQIFSLNTSLAYSVNVQIDKLAFEDGSVWRNDIANWFELSEQSMLVEGVFPRLKQLRRETLACKNDAECQLYMPVKHEEYWQCICGSPAKDGMTCPCCGETTEHLDTIMAQDYLETQQKAYIRSVAEKRATIAIKLYTKAKEEERQKQEVARIEDQKKQEKARKAEEAKKDSAYSAALALAAKRTSNDMEIAIKELEFLNGWKDSKEKIAEYKKELEQIRAEERAEQERIVLNKARKAKKAKRTITISAILIMLAVVGVLAITKVIIPSQKYNAAEKLFLAGEFDQAADAFSALGDFKDSANMVSVAYDQKTELIKLVKYEEAEQLLLDGKTADAAIAFGRLGDYKDAEEQSLALWDTIAQRNVIFADYDMTLALQKNGSVVFCGRFYENYEISDWKGLTSIVGVGYHVAGLLPGGSYMVGGSIGQSDKKVVAIDMASNGDIAKLYSDGTVERYNKDNEYGQCNVSDWTDIISISINGCDTIGLRSDGRVLFAGQCADTQGKSISTWTNIVAIATSPGCERTVGLREDGTVVVAGKNSLAASGLEDWKDIVALDTTIWHTVGLRSDGTVVATGENRYGECNVAAWENIVAISAGWTHTVGLCADGTIVAVGDNRDGQCDVSNWRNIKVPN